MNMKKFFGGKKTMLYIIIFIVLIVGTIIFVNSGKCKRIKYIL